MLHYQKCVIIKDMSDVSLLTEEQCIMLTLQIILKTQWNRCNAIFFFTINVPTVCLNWYKTWPFHTGWVTVFSEASVYHRTCCKLIHLILYNSSLPSDAHLSDRIHVSLLTSLMGLSWSFDWFSSHQSTLLCAVYALPHTLTGYGKQPWFLR